MRHIALLTVCCSLVSAPALADHTLSVDDTGDNLTVDGKCTLREAIQRFSTTSTAAGDCPIDDSSGAHAQWVIRVPSGTYTISGAASEDANASGDYDLIGKGDGSADSKLIIKWDAAGVLRPTISGGSLDRIFDFHTPAAYNATVTLQELVLTSGNAPEAGGAIRFEATGATPGAAGAQLKLLGVTIVSSTSAVSGGALFVNWAGGAVLLDSVGAGITLSRTIIGANGSANAAPDGGGIDINAGSVTLAAATITSNTTAGTGGGVRVGGTGSFQSNNATSAIGPANQAANGGGIALTSLTASVTIDQGSVSSNIATTAGGGAAVTAGTMTVNAGGTIGPNNASPQGGGVSLTNNGSFTLNSGKVDGNGTSAGTPSANSTNGGGIYFNAGPNSQLTIKTTTTSPSISNNTATLAGGGLEFGGTGGIGGPSGVQTADFDNNQVTAGNGGAINYHSASALLITGGSLTNNKALAGHGGAIYAISPTCSGSQLLHLGGGVHVGKYTPAGPGPAVDNGNSAVMGGGVFLAGCGTSGGAPGTWQLSTDGGAFFEGNDATSHGGAIANGNDVSNTSGHTVSAPSANFSYNIAGGDGGAYYAAGDQAIAFGKTHFGARGTFDHNSATSGGAIFHNVTGNLLELSGLVFSNNQAIANGGPNGHGGAIAMGASSNDIDLTASHFSNNQADISGGAIALRGFNAAAAQSIARVSFTANQALTSGGALFNESAAPLTVVNSTFDANMATASGGAVSNAGTIAIRSSTLTTNNAASGGGVGNTGNATYRDTIFLSNGGGECTSGTSTTSEGNNLTFAGSTPCFAAEVTTPRTAGELLRALQNNLHTNEPSSNAKTRAPLFFFSPQNEAVDTGSGCAGITLDARQVARVNQCDIGAHETELDVSITNVAAPATVHAGNNVTFSVTPSNSAASATLSPHWQLDLGPLLLVSAPASAGGWTCTAPAVGASGIVRCDGANLAASASQLLTFVAKVPSTQTLGVLTHDALLSPELADAALADNKATSSFTVDGLVAHAVTMTRTTAGATLDPGTFVSYDITITNPGGPSTASGANVTATLDVRFVTPSWTCAGSAGGSCAAASGSGALSGAGFTLPPGGSVVFSLSALIDPAATGTTVTASGNVVAPLYTGGAAGGSATSFDISAVVPVASLSTAITSNVDPTITAGTSFVVTATSTNGGPKVSQNLTSTTVIGDASVVFEAINASQPGWTCMADKTAGQAGPITVTCTCAPTGCYLGLGAEDTAKVQVHLAASAAAGTTETINGTLHGDFSADGTAMKTLTVATSADLTLTSSSAPMPAEIGNNVTLTYDVTNTGPSDAQGVSFTVTLPTGFGFISVMPASGFTCTTPAVGADGAITCSGGNIANATSAEFIVEALVAATLSAGDASAAASVTATTSDPDTANDGDTLALTLVPGGSSGDGSTVEGPTGPMEDNAEQAPMIARTGCQCQSSRSGIPGELFVLAALVLFLRRRQR